MVAADGRVLFARDPDTRLAPASNAKILTALAALDTFGPTHRFATRILADRPLPADGVVGRLVVSGGGDPSLTSEQVWRLTADLARRGLRRVSGDLILDASVFDDQGWNPEWGTPSARAYHAPVAGLAANYGAFTVEAAPGAPGGPAIARIDPPTGYFDLVNRATTTKGKGRAIEVSRSGGSAGDRVVVSGKIGAAAAPIEIYRSVTDTVLYTGHLIRAQLAANGIIVDGAIRSGRAIPGDQLLMEFEGKPLGEIVRLFMKYSNNNIAESLVKSLGQHAAGTGSWATGIPALHAKLSALGVPGDGVRLVDGSGLARSNRVSPRALVEALRIGAGSFRYGPELLAALPIAGRDGTLRRRASSTTDHVRAKTGLLTGATGLSGVVETRGAGRVYFSVLANGYANGDVAAMAAADRFAAAVRDL